MLPQDMGFIPSPALNLYRCDFVSFDLIGDLLSHELKQHSDTITRGICNIYTNLILKRPNLNFHSLTGYEGALMRECDNALLVLLRAHRIDPFRWYTFQSIPARQKPYNSERSPQHGPSIDDLHEEVTGEHGFGSPAVSGFAYQGGEHS